MKIIIDCSRKGEENRIIEDYAYLAPVMYMQYFDLFYYTDRVLYNRMIRTNTHPLPKERICHLFAIANDDKYDFDTEMEITCMQVFWMHMMNIAHSCS